MTLNELLMPSIHNITTWNTTTTTRLREWITSFNIGKTCKNDHTQMCVPTRSKAPKSRALIISGYTCIGKTYFCNDEQLQNNLNLGEVIDLDSSMYSRDNFPANYLEAIRRTADADLGAPRVILVSTFPGVATQLQQEGYYVAQVYPEGGADCKKEWLARLERREVGGKESRLYGLVRDNWDAWFEEMGHRKVSVSRVVSADEYLGTIIKEIHDDFIARRGDGDAVIHHDGI